MLSYLQKRLRSFTFAFKGIASAFRAEPNMQIHLAAAVAVVLLSAWLGLERWEWATILTAIGLVWLAELFNTALEELTDLASPDFHPLAGRAKDLAAGAVLIASILAVLLGTIVFLPYGFAFFS